LLRSQEDRGTFHTSVFGIAPIWILVSAHVAGRERAELEGIVYKVWAPSSEYLLAGEQNVILINLAMAKANDMALMFMMLVST